MQLLFTRIGWNCGQFNNSLLARWKFLETPEDRMLPLVIGSLFIRGHELEPSRKSRNELHLLCGCGAGIVDANLIFHRPVEKTASCSRDSNLQLWSHHFD